jgi:hypothetical protein
VKYILPLIGLSVAAVVIFDFGRQYLKSISTGWGRVWDAGRGSATVVWQQFGLVVSGLVMGADRLIDWVCAAANDPSAADAIKGVINSYFTPPVAGLVGLAFIAITIKARMRTL